MLIKCKFKLFLLVSILSLSVLLFATVGLAGEWIPKSIRMGTAVASASIYRLGAPISIVLTKALNMPVSAQDSGGSAENCRLLDKKEVEMALVVGPSDYFAYNGLPPFNEPITSLRSVMVVDENPMQMFVLADSDIKSIPDLKGKKICVGANGSGQDVMSRAILAEFDMSYDDVEEVYASSSVGAGLFQNGDIDAMTSIIAIPGPWITELSLARKIRLLPLPDDVINHLTSENVFFRKTIVPKGTYNGVDEDVPGVAAVSAVIVHEDLDDTLVYNMIKCILDNKDIIAETYPGAKKFLTEEVALEGLSVPMHPGAIKYFEEINHPGLQDAPK